MQHDLLIKDRQWIEQSTRFIPIQWHLTELLDLLTYRDINHHRLLSGSGLFYEDIIKGESFISPTQLHSILNNLLSFKQLNDTGFLLGERQLHSRFNAISPLIENANNMQMALALIERYYLLLYPLCQLRTFQDGDKTYLIFYPLFGQTHNEQFLVEFYCAFLNTLYPLVTHKKPTWQLFFRYSKPANHHFYTERFGEVCHFNAQANVIQFPTQDLIATNHKSQPTTASSIAEHYCNQQLTKIPGQSSLSLHLYDYLLQHIQHPPKLEETAHIFSISPATLKRKLSAQKSSYQQLLDLARSHCALYLLYCKAYSNEQIAQYLNFHDSRNFRRSFKRWTGTLPSILRAQTI